MSESERADGMPERVETYAVRGGVELKIHLYLPKAGEHAEGLRPAIVFVHGGGWSGGNPSQFFWHAKEAAALGYVGASVQYRLSGVAPYPAALDDAQAAVRWLRAHAGELRIDPNRVGAMGSSAGGHLVACLGVRDTRPSSEPIENAGHSSKVQCVVDVHGVHDLPAIAWHRVADGACVPFLGGTLREKRALWEDASPLRFVNATSAPTLVIHDPGDKTVPYEDSVAFAHALMKANRPVEFMPTPGAGHGFVYTPHGEWTQRVMPVAWAWFSKFLK